MNDLCYDFGLDLETLSAFLTVTNGFIAGSAALQSYIVSEMPYKTKTWSPNDIDIWIPVPGLLTRSDLSTHYDADDDVAKMDASLRHLVTHFMKARLGYTKTLIDASTRNCQLDYIETCEMNPFIAHVLTFENADGKIGHWSPSKSLDSIASSGVCQLALAGMMGKRR